jgi:hypothetical protein
MKNKDGYLCLLALLLTIAIIIFLSAIPRAVSFEVPHTETALASTITTDSTSTPEKVTKSPNAETTLPKVLLDIAWCESRNNQSAIGYNYRTRTITLEDGSTTTEKYVWSKDIGTFQINDFYHLETARKMGFDIYTVEGNTQYALFLYNSNGTRDWNPSKPCWSDIEAWRAKEKSYY